MKDLISQQNNPAGWDQAQTQQEEMNPFFWTNGYLILTYKQII